MTQIALPLAWREEPRDAAFIVSRSNAQAVRTLEHWSTWPVMAALLVGPRRSGRSLLARLFAATSHGRVIDDAEQAPEEELFHAWNRAQAEREPLLIVAHAAPPAWQPALPDLRTRLAASPVATIGAPEDELVRALLERGFARRRIDARGEVVAWLAARVPRSHAGVAQVLDCLDRVTLGRQRRLTIPLAREALATDPSLREPDDRA